MKILVYSNGSTDIGTLADDCALHPEVEVLVTHTAPDTLRALRTGNILALVVVTADAASIELATLATRWLAEPYGMLDRVVFLDYHTDGLSPLIGRFTEYVAFLAALKASIDFAMGMAEEADSSLTPTSGLQISVSPAPGKGGF